MRFNIELTESILLILLGGLFGWSLGKLSDKIVYGVVAVAIILISLVLKK